MAEKKRPPYASAVDIEALFGRMRTMQAPKKIDTEWAATYNLAPKQPEAIPNLLKWLGIIDKEGEADAAVWDPVRIPQSRAEVLEPLIRSAYSDVFDRIDVEHATQDDLSGAFVNAYGMGDPRRQVRCFLVLCGMAGISTGTEAKKKPGPASREPGAAKEPRAARTPSRSTPSAAAKKDEKNGRAMLPQAGGVFVSLAVEIPAEWNEDQIRERLITVSRAMGEAGLGAA